VQHRDHRRHGQPARRVHRRPARLRRGVPRRRLPAPLAQGAVQLLAADRHPALPPGRPLRQAHAMRTGRGWAAALAVAVLLALPLVLSGYAVTIFILIFFYAFLAQAWNVVGGYAGQLSAGHAAFVGIGGYTAALLFDKGVTPWIGMFVGAALASVLGAIIGYLGFRFGLRGFYFVLLTVAFAEICRILASNIDAVGGAVGLYITFTGNPRQFQFQ